MAFYIRDLRNKYDHANSEDILPEEVFADCLVVLCFTSRSKHLLENKSPAEGVEAIILNLIPRLLDIFIEKRNILLDSNKNLSEPTSMVQMPESARPTPYAAIEQKLDELMSYAQESRQDLDATRKESLALRSLLASLAAQYVTLAEQTASRPSMVEQTDTDEDDFANPSDFDEDTEQPVRSAILPSLTVEEARELLIALRWRIWDELGIGPSTTGILRKSLMLSFLKNRITSAEALALSQDAIEQLQKTEPNQLKYLPDIFAIVSRISSSDSSL
ncbi:MAG: hypothetical protein K8R92_04215 [Planctomycetes bacterium]|nr:hypothetical protein [Planctomycetota bacterium]